jgi:hypothetical protein
MFFKSGIALVIGVIAMQAGGLPIATADIIATDSFNYPVGELWSANGGTGWISPCGGNGMAANGGQALTDNVGNPPKCNSRTFNIPGITDYFDIATRTTSADVFRDDFVAFHAATLTIYGNQPGIRFDNVVISNMASGVGLRSMAVPEPGVASGIGVAAPAFCSVFFRRRRRSEGGWLCNN